MRRKIEELLAGLAAVIFPTLLVAIAGGTLLWKLAQVDAVPATELPVRVWMQDTAVPEPDHKTVLNILRASEPTSSLATKLATNDFWLALDVGSQFGSGTHVVDFPSRHTVALTCWDSLTDVLLGEANRWSTAGQLSYSRSGFALSAKPDHPLGQVLCKASFRGPAKISARAWPVDALRSAPQVAHLPLLIDPALSPEKRDQ